MSNVIELHDDVRVIETFHPKPLRPHFRPYSSVDDWLGSISQWVTPEVAERHSEGLLRLIGSIEAAMDKVRHYERVD